MTAPWSTQPVSDVVLPHGVAWGGQAGTALVFPFTFPATFSVSTAGLPVDAALPKPLSWGAPVVPAAVTVSASLVVSAGLSAAGSYAGSLSAPVVLSVGLASSGSAGLASSAPITLSVGLSAAGSAASADAGTAVSVTSGSSGSVGFAVGGSGTVVAAGLSAAAVLGMMAGDSGSSLVAGLSTAGMLSSVAGQQPVIIPNAFVGPQALRNAFRPKPQTQANITGLTRAATTAITATLSASGSVSRAGAYAVMVVPNPMVGPQALRYAFKHRYM